MQQLQQPQVRKSRLDNLTKGKLVNLSRKSAVVLTIAPSNSTTYADVMDKARNNINLPEIGIPDIRVWRSLAGGIILEIPRKSNATKINILAGRLKALFPSNVEVRVSHPVKKPEVRVSGLDDSVIPVVAAAVEVAGECDPLDVQTGDIHQSSPHIMGTIWLKCPAAAAKISQRLSG